MACLSLQISQPILTIPPWTYSKYSSLPQSTNLGFPIPYFIPKHFPIYSQMTQFLQKWHFIVWIHSDFANELVQMTLDTRALSKQWGLGLLKKMTLCLALFALPTNCHTHFEDISHVTKAPFISFYRKKRKPHPVPTRPPNAVNSPCDFVRNRPLDVDGRSLPQTSVDGPQIRNGLYSILRWKNEQEMSTFYKWCILFI